MVTPSFNQGRFLERTITSVLEQGYPRLEYVVQDGGSSDETVGILERHTDRLFRWQSAPDRGQAHAVNCGFAHSTGDIMAFLNADDLLLPGALHYVARFLARHPEVDVIYGQRVIVDDQDAEVGRWVLPPHDDVVLCWNDYVPQETVFWRRRIWDKAGAALDENLHFALDWDLLLRFRAAGARFARLPRFLAAFRIHPRQKTATRLLDLGLPEMNRLRELCHARPVSRWEVRFRVLPFLCRHMVCQYLFQLGLLNY